MNKYLEGQSNITNKADLTDVKLLRAWERVQKLTTVNSV